MLVDKWRLELGLADLRLAACEREREKCAGSGLLLNCSCSILALRSLVNTLLTTTFIVHLLQIGLLERTLVDSKAVVHFSEELGRSDSCQPQ